MEISGKVFVVTGAGNGIGREVALELVRRGGAVAGVDISAEGLSQTASLAGGSAKQFASFVVDLSKRKDVIALPAKVEKALGPVDAVINVAGIIQPFVRVNDLDFDAVDRVMGVNFFGPLNVIKAFLPGLLSRPTAHITNVSSMGSYAPVPGQTVYGASKAALNLLSEGMRSELKGTSVGLTVVYPGAIGTNIAANSGIHISAPEGQREMKVVSAADAGKAIVEATEHARRRIVIGSDAKTMWALNRIHSDLAANVIYQGMKSLLP